MAKYTITMSCGHDEVKQLFGKSEDRERKIKYYEEYGLCEECYKKHVMEKEKNEDLVFNAEVLPWIDNEGDIIISAWFTGSTLTHKDEIKTLVGYSWGQRHCSSDMYTLNYSDFFWNKLLKLKDLDEELKKAESINAVCKISQDKLCSTNSYKKAKSEQKKWDDAKQKIGEIKKPVTPEIIRDKKWNRTIYGKAGNYSIYPNGDKTFISDEQAEELRNYLTLQAEYREKINKIEKEINS